MYLNKYLVDTSTVGDRGGLHPTADTDSLYVIRGFYLSRHIKPDNSTEGGH